jgi:hypothetical protein
MRIDAEIALSNWMPALCMLRSLGLDMWRAFCVAIFLGFSES